MSSLRSACEHLVASQGQMRLLANLERRIRSSPTPNGCKFVLEHAYAMQREEATECARVLAASPAANDERRPAA
jgi:hypothetical protein